MGDGDEQSEKRAAAAAYDYEGDKRWSLYLANILIPSHLPASDVILHYKHKFYRQYIDPDFLVEPRSFSNYSQTSRPSTTTAAPSSSSQQARPRNSGSGGGSSNQTGTNAGSVGLNRRTLQFLGNAWVCIMGVLAIFPLLPQNLSNKAYRSSFLGSACSSLYSLYFLHGKPRAWNLQAIQTWLQSMIATKDFLYFLYSLTFVMSHLHIKLALIPVICRSVELIAKFLRRNFTNSPIYRKYLEESCIWVESNTTTLNIMSSNAEVGLGFFLILSLLSWQRSILLTVMYWQLLKLMYFSPATAGYHQSVWAKIGRSVNPLIHRYAPFLITPLSAVQKWWLR